MLDGATSLTEIFTMDMNDAIRHGNETAISAFNSADFSKISRLIKDAKSHDDGRRAHGKLAFRGCIMQLSKIIQCSTAAGHRFTPAIPTAAEIAYHAATDTDEFWKQSALVLAAAGKLRVYLPSMRVKEKTPNVPAKRTDPAPTPPAAPAKPPQPIEVVVVSMPARKTTTGVDRNMAGEITGAVQIESDA